MYKKSELGQGGKGDRNGGRKRGPHFSLCVHVPHEAHIWQVAPQETFKPVDVSQNVQPTLDGR